jgi:glucose-6-phosphate 1-dehydrogenase
MPCASSSLEAPPDQDLVIFGATGDLARRKLLPALYDVAAEGMLPRKGRIVGVSRRPVGDAEFRGLAKEAIKDRSRHPFDAALWQELAPRLSYLGADEAGFAALRETSLQERLIYLATPPDSFAGIVASLAEHGLSRGSRLVIEKPFGYDLLSGRRLNQQLHAAFDESQIFRIDHFLGKETVQNLLVFRFANAVFERVWNRDAIDHIEVTVAESIGIEGRASFYEEVGALRDVLQNHVLQLLAVLTMEPPISLRGEPVREEKAKLLRAARPLRPEDVVRGQYTAGFADGDAVPGYRDEPEVSSASDVETFVAARLWIDNWRWAGVPVLLRTGKRLPSRRTVIEIAFRSAPTCYFEGTGISELRANHLRIEIQPEEQISFSFLMKAPGSEFSIQPAEMRFSYEGANLPDPAEAYERLIHDAMWGEHTLFVRQDSIERAWEIVQPVLDGPPPLHFYPAGTWGPPEADQLIAPHLWSLR